MQPNAQLESTPLRQRLVAALALFLVLLACVSQDSVDDQPRHGWWEGNGIVVPHDSFPSDCRLCHVEGSWNELREDFSFDHVSETGISLSGAHNSAKCLRCHNDRGPVQLFSQQGCKGCHEDVHRGNLGTECASCHGEQTWVLREEIAVHNRTRFPLVGAHAAAACWSCHPGGEVGNWSRQDIECAACHGELAPAVQSPDHVANGWVEACDRCHIPTTWDGAGFNHFAFPLTGAHASADCSACHVGDVYTGLPTDCAGCHSDEYQQTTDPNHAAAGFPMQCELCHQTGQWEGAIFNHAGVNNGCVVCHQQDYDRASDPDHAANNFSTSCEQCHTTGTWEGASFQHIGISDGCVNCHLQDYAGTTNPNHPALGISQSCEECHVTSTWLGASFDHQGITNGCFACHQSDYNGATDPNHLLNGISTSCEDCHGTDTWLGATFSHRGITTGCFNCHQSDYNQTNHAAQGFPTTCEVCHDTNSWDGANFNHTSFPINSGNHSNLDCIDCHTVPTSYPLFSCIDCHEHNFQDMASKHNDVNGYSWTSPACYNCHPNGNAPND